MKRQFGMATVLCFTLVVLMALTAAPIASAAAVFTEIDAIETYAGPPNPATPTPWVTGGVAHWTFNNLLRETSSSPLFTGFNSTHVDALFDPETGEGTMRGTWRIVLDGGLGVWEGTFAGSVSLATGYADINITGRGVSGEIAGMVFRGRDLNTDGVTGVVTGTILAPRGL